MRPGERVTKASVLRSLGMVVVAAGWLAGCSESPPPDRAAPEQPAAQAPAGTPAGQPVAKPGAQQQAVKKTPEPLIVWIEAEPEEGPPPLEVHFTAMIKGGTPPIKLQWKFGDESKPSSQRNPVHTYAKPGSYWAELYASDAGEDEDDDDYEIVVEAPEQDDVG